jgi:hypothetical protein
MTSPSRSGGDALSSGSSATYCSPYLAPIETYLPDAAPRLDEMTETFLRFYLSLLAYDSAVTETDAALRGYLHRVLVPALGLPAEQQGHR